MRIKYLIQFEKDDEPVKVSFEHLREFLLYIERELHRRGPIEWMQRIYK